MNLCVAKVRRWEAVTAFVYVVELALEKAVDYVPGQYLMVHMGEGDQRPFSIASIPADGRQIVLHIGATPENPYAWEVLERIRRQGEIAVSLPYGDAGYKSVSQRPLMLVAGGTGFSYTWSILQAYLASTQTQSVVLYWGVRHEADLYSHQQLLALENRYPHFTYVPVVELPATENWQGARGKVLDALVRDCASTLANHDVYIAGRFEMVRIARDTFTALGLPRTQLFGDALSFL